VVVCFAAASCGGGAGNGDSATPTGEAELSSEQDTTSVTTSPTDTTSPADAADTVDTVGESTTTASEPTTTTSAPPPRLAPSAPGDSGTHVAELQQALAELGLTGGEDLSEGSYDSSTATAVENFQRLADLAPTGEADAETTAALEDYDYTGPFLARGDEGDAVELLQTRLASGPFDPGAIDGKFGVRTQQAVWALEKLAGVPVDGEWGPFDDKAWRLLQRGDIGQPEKTHDVRWVEVDLSEQLVKVFDPGIDTAVLISHASSGSGVPWANETASGNSVTPLGDYHITRRIAGWRVSSLNIGSLYNPLYFNGGIAFHGATSVPLQPASHGCVRVPMHIAEYLPAELPNDTPVSVVA
jgi:peptidoglycan hydrolase-like protein with peptidoglycan-binding domain